MLLSVLGLRCCVVACRCSEPYGIPLPLPLRSKHDSSWQAGYAAAAKALCLTAAKALGTVCLSVCLSGVEVPFRQAIFRSYTDATQLLQRAAAATLGSNQTTAILPCRA